jgi:hypothetical protein
MNHTPHIDPPFGSRALANYEYISEVLPDAPG